MLDLDIELAAEFVMEPGCLPFSEDPTRELLPECGDVPVCGASFSSQHF
jgi:hypothetical protein